MIAQYLQCASNSLEMLTGLGRGSSELVQQTETNLMFLVLYVPCSVHSLDILNFGKRPTGALECMNVVLLHSNHRRVSATRVAI